MQVRKQVRTGHGTTDWFQIGKGVHQGCILSPCLFNFYAEYIMRNAGLEEAQAGIKIPRRNINNLPLHFILFQPEIMYQMYFQISSNLFSQKLFNDL